MAGGCHLHVKEEDKPVSPGLLRQITQRDPKLTNHPPASRTPCRVTSRQTTLYTFFCINLIRMRSQICPFANMRKLRQERLLPRSQSKHAQEPDHTASS